MDRKESYSIIGRNRQLKGMFFVLFFVVIAALVYVFRHYYWPLLTALILYAVLQPLYNRILARIQRPVLAASILVCLMIIVIVVPVLFFFLALADQAYQLYLMIQHKISLGVLDEIQRSELFNRLVLFFGVDQAEIISRVTQSMQRVSMQIISGITAVLSYPLAFAVKFFFMVLMLFFLFKDGARFASTFYRMMPFPDDIEMDVVARINSVVKVLVAGNLLIMMLQGLMVGIGLAITGLGMPLLWGSVAAVLSLIPVVGTTIIWIPAAAILALKGSYAAALFLGLWCLFWYFLLENLVKPVILGDRLNFHPLLFFFLLLGSIQTFGLAGVIAGPVLLTLFYSLWEIYQLLNEHNGSAGGGAAPRQGEAEHGSGGS